MSYIQQFFTSRDNNANAETFVGQEGRLWWDPATNQIYSSDGNTPGGIPLSGGGGGNGTPGGSNSQVQFNQAGNFGGSANLTFNSVTGALTAVSIAGNGAGLTNIAGSNVVGEVANATYATLAGSATTAGTVTTNAQPNITSVGTLTTVVSTGNISTTGNVTGNYILGNGSQLTGLSATYGNANVSTFLAAFGSNVISTTGNITGGNLLTGGIVEFAGGSRLRPIGANLDIVAGAGSYVNLTTSDDSSYMGVDNAGGYIATAGGTWAFNTDGTTTFPGNIINSNTNPITLWSTDSSTLLWRSPTGGGPGSPIQTTVSADNGNATISVSTGTLSVRNIETWTFDSAGNTTFPDTTVQTTAYPGTATSFTVTGNITGGNVIGTTGVAVGGTGGDLTMTGGAITGVGNITANGIVAINAPGGITTTQGSFDIVNATATTVNLGGSATAVNIGAITGTVTINNPTIVGSQTSLTLFNTTASNVSAFGAASNLIVGATSGTMTLRNPTIVGTQTTQSLFNTVATTVNFAGAATALNIGGAGNATFSANTLVRIANTSGSALSVAGNITGGNLLTGGSVSATGNIGAGGNPNYYGFATTTKAITVVAPTSGYAAVDVVGSAGNAGSVNFGNVGTRHASIDTDSTRTLYLNVNVLGTGNAVSQAVAIYPNLNASFSNAISATANVTGGNLLTGGLISATGNITGGNITTTGAVYSNFNTNTANTASFNATGGNTKGGTGYLDFLVAQNTSGGATNPYKWLRLNSDGQLQIINSAYTQNIFNLTDAGVLTVPGPILVSGKQAVNGPAFRAYVDSGQTISTDSQQKVTFGGETFDTNSNFSSSRFTPTVEGYYQLNATVRLSGNSGTGECMIILYKNGSEYARGTNESGTEQGQNFWSMQVSDIAYANGSTDYFEIYIQQGSATNRTTTAGSTISYFSGVMVRGA